MMEEIKKEAAITAKEIADDVQQTLDNCSNEYRSRIERYINELIQAKMLDVHDGVKRIFSHHFTAERTKQRITNVLENGELLNHLGSALTVIETSVKEDIKRLLIKGEDVLKIVPKRQHEK